MRLILASLLLSATLAVADDRAVVEAICVDPEAEAATRVAACTAILETTTEGKEVQSFYRVHRGNARASAAQWDEALADYAAALALQPDNADAFHNRGNTYIDMGRYRDAVADFDRAIALNRDDALAYNNRCWSWLLEGEALAALADCETAVFLEPEDAHAQDSIGFVLLRLNRVEEAVSRFDAAIAADPALASPWYGRALAHRLAGRAARADADLEQARFLDAELEEKYRALGLLPD